MKEYIVKCTKEVVKEGDKLVVAWGEFELNEKTIPALVSLGVLVEKEEGEKEKEDKLNGKYHFDLYACRIASRIDWSVDNVKKYLFKLNEINSAALANILFMEIAVRMDEKYQNNIKSEEKIYTVDMGTGFIRDIRKEHIEEYAFIPAFRKVEEVEAAARIFRSIANYIAGTLRDARK